MPTGFNGSSDFNGRNMSGGSSVMSGQSEYVGSNPGLEMLGRMGQFFPAAVQLTLPGMISSLIEITKHYAKENKELKMYETAFATARELAEEKKTMEALDFIKDTISQMEVPGKFKEVVDQFQTVIQNSYEEMLSYNNNISRDSLQEFCKEMVEKSEDPEEKTAWETVSKIVDESKERTGEINAQMCIEAYDYENWKLPFIAENLKRVGIPAQVFYGQPNTDENAKGYIITPILPEEAVERLRGIEALANVSHKMKNVMTQDLYDAMCKVAPTSKGGKHYSEHLELSGLTRAEAEMMREALFSDYNNIGVPIAVVETQSGDGTWSVLYPKEEEAAVNSAFVRCLLSENGYGKLTTFEKDILGNVEIQDKVQGAITLLSKGHGDCIFVVDTSKTAGRSDDNAKMPDHFLKIEQYRVEECEAVLDEATGEWAVKTIDKIDLKNLPHGLSADEVIHNKVNHLCKNPLILGESQAEKFGITRDEFRPEQRLKSYVQKMRDPMIRSGVIGEKDPEKRREIVANGNAQSFFVKFAASQAARECKDDPSIENISEYIADNKDSLIDEFFESELKKIQKAKSFGKLSPEAAEKETKLLKETVDRLKNMNDPEYGLSANIKQAQDIINGRVITGLYEANIFSAEAISSDGIDEKELFDVQRKLARARAMADTPLAQNSFSAAVKQVQKETIEDRVRNNKMRLRRSYPGISESALEARACLAEFSENLHNAVFKGADLEDPNEYSQKYGFDIEQAAMNIDEKIYKDFGLHIDEITDNDARKFMSQDEIKKADAALDAVDPAIRFEVVRQMKEGAARQSREQDR